MQGGELEALHIVEAFVYIQLHIRSKNIVDAGAIETWDDRDGSRLTRMGRQQLLYKSHWAEIGLAEP